jgi:YegS C-terminal NAD kinase beta sandwich-like domain
MTVEKGRPWGEPGSLPDGGVVARSDAEVAEVVERARRAGQPVPAVGLLGGDLCRTVGGRGDEARIRSGAGVLLPCDVGAALLDGRLHWFVAHLVARRSWWRGRVFAAMNAQWLGRWDVAPRAHPGDGLLDVVDVVGLGIGDRWKAARRLPSGTHVPHPGIVQRRAAAVQASFDPPLPVWLDGRRMGPVRNLSVRVEPDALLVVV